MSSFETAIRQHLALKRNRGAAERDLADAQALLDGRGAADGATPGPSRPRPRRRPAARAAGAAGSLLRLVARRKRRTAAVAVGLLVALALPSYATTMLRASDTGYGVRSVEWLRDHGAAGIVVEGRVRSTTR